MNQENPLRKSTLSLEKNLPLTPKKSERNFGGLGGKTKKDL